MGFGQDADGDVDLTDFESLSDCVDGPTTPSAPGCAHMDLNMNGTNDLADYALFQIAFTGP